MKIIKHSAIYFIGNIIRYSSSFIMLPIYTHYLEVAEYGVVELLSLMVDIVAIAVGMRLGQSIFRYYNLAETQSDKQSIITSALFLTLAMNLIGYLIIFSSSSLYHSFIGSDLISAYNVQLFGLILIFNGVTEILMIYLRVREKPVFFVSFSVVKLGFQIACNVYFLVILNQGIEGFITASVISSAAAALFAATYVVLLNGTRFDKSKIKAMAVFSYPIVLAEIGTFYISFGDRFVLAKLTSLEAVGVYALAFKFSAILLALIWMPFMSIWDNEKYNIYKKTDAIRIFQSTFKSVTLLLVLSGLGIATLSSDIIKIMTDEMYWPAISIVPIMLLTAIVQALCVFTNFGLLLKGNTFEITKASAVAVLTISLVIYPLTYLFGLYGAATSVLIAQIARLVWISSRSNIEYSMHLNWYKLILLIACTIPIYFFMTLIEFNTFINAFLKVVILMGGAYAVWISRYFNTHEKDIYFKSISSILPARFNKPSKNFNR